MFYSDKILKMSIKVFLNAGKATPIPPLGPLFNKFGLNASNFCKEYNEKTKEFFGQIIPVQIYIFEDKSYSYNILSVPTSQLILSFLDENLNKRRKQGEIIVLSKNILLDICNKKKLELNTTNETAIRNIIIGTAKNMGVTFENN